jgi:hypothetical protein
MPQQTCQAFDDGKPQSQALAPVAMGIAELLKLDEDVVEMRLRDTRTGVVDLEAQVVVASAGAQQDPAIGGITQGIAQQITQDPLQHTRIALSPILGWANGQGISLLPSHGQELAVELTKQGCNGYRFGIGGNYPGIQLGDVQQGAQHGVDRRDRPFDMIDQRLPFGVTHLVRQGGEGQAQGMDRLAQVMAGGGQEAGLGRIGPFRFQ